MQLAVWAPFICCVVNVKKRKRKNYLQPQAAHPDNTCSFSEDFDALLSTRDPRCFPKNANALRLLWMKEFPLFSILVMKVFSIWMSTFTGILGFSGAAWHQDQDHDWFSRIQKRNKVLLDAQRGRGQFLGWERLAGVIFQSRLEMDGLFCAVHWQDINVIY